MDDAKDTYLPCCDNIPDVDPRLPSEAQQPTDTSSVSSPATTTRPTSPSATPTAASVPTREPYSLDCRPQEIQAAINALAQVVLGRRKLVWGGHPAITPLLWSAAQAVGVEYTVAVELFQSKLFTKVLPAENKYFANVRLIDRPTLTELISNYSIILMI